MPRVTFVYPGVGRAKGQRPVRSWQMQPLAIAVLSGLTPASWQKSFFDDRLQAIDYETSTDLVAISIETFTARRGYQIAARFRARGVPVVMGGYHATFLPDEVLRHADAVCIGEAEGGAWEQILADAAASRLGGRYQSSPVPKLDGVQVDRSIFAGRNYFRLGLVETGRGCPNSCRFCSIAGFHQGRSRFRPVPEVLDEIAGLPDRNVFFIDDNIVADQGRAFELFQGLARLGVRWVGQATLAVARNRELLETLAASGCVGLLVGFESLDPQNLRHLDKRVNSTADYRQCLRLLHQKGIAVYGTFMLGLPGDTRQRIEETVQFARSEKLFLAAFNHLVPFPGTPLFDELRRENRLLADPWWLSPGYRFGQVVFRPQHGSAAELEQWCLAARRSFYGLGSILGRAANVRANSGGWRRFFLYFWLNLLMAYEVSRKRGIPLGDLTEDGDKHGLRPL